MSAEATEETIMRPLIFSFSQDYLRDYFRAHAAEEARHAMVLRGYIRDTFGHEKRRKTIADRVFHDGCYRALTHIGGSRPLPFLAALLFYECFSEWFYRELRESAQCFELIHLSDLLRDIEKDEIRHRTGLRLVLRDFRRLKGAVRTTDFLFARVLLETILADMSTAKIAVYNRHVRRNLQVIGIDPDTMVIAAREAAESVLREIAELKSCS